MECKISSFVHLSGMLLSIKLLSVLDIVFLKNTSLALDWIKVPVQKY